MENLIFKTSIYGHLVVGEIETVAKPIQFRPTTKAESIIDDYMNENNLESRSQAVNAIIEAFQLKPISAQEPTIHSFNYLEFAEQHPCSHQLIDFDSQKHQWTCAGKKISKSICCQRHRRFLHYGKECFPQHLAHHCRNCGKEIRPKYTRCYPCNQERQEKKADDYLPNATKRFTGDII